MAAIPDAGGAQCAPCGVSRAVLRFAMLGGLVITGWLLTSGIAQAHENPSLASAFSGLSGVNEVRVAPLSPLNATDLNATDTAPPPDEVLGVDEVGSTVVGALRARLPVQPAPAPVLAPVLEPVSTLAAPDPKNAGNATQSQATVAEPPMAPPTATPAEPIAPAAAVTTPAPVLRAASDTPSATPVHVVSYPMADLYADQIASPAGPAAPVPASPPGTATAPCPGGNAGGGSTTQSDNFVAHSDGWATTGLTPTLCRLRVGAGGIPPWAAQRPTTSPD